MIEMTGFVLDKPRSVKPATPTTVQNKTKQKNTSAGSQGGSLQGCTGTQHQQKLYSADAPESFFPYTVPTLGCKEY